jgi:SAM-dependent methyltransferase
VSAEREAAARAALAGGGARDWSARNPGNRAIREELAVAALAAAAPIAAGPPGRAFLDAGCGTGWFLERLAAEGAEDLHGVDLLTERVAAAAARVPSARVERADVGELPYGDGRFAAVFLFTVLSSLPDRASVRAAVAEAWRVGERVIVWEPRVPTPRNRATRLVRLADHEAATGVRPQTHSLTLLPPLARRLGPRAYARLAAVPALRTHRLASLARRT